MFGVVHGVHSILDGESNIRRSVAVFAYPGHSYRARQHLEIDRYQEYSLTSPFYQLLSIKLVLEPPHQTFKMSTHL